MQKQRAWCSHGKAKSDRRWMWGEALLGYTLSELDNIWVQIHLGGQFDDVQRISG